MRAFTLVLLFALLAVGVSAARFSLPSSSFADGLGAPVPYKWCGSSSDDATIDSIVSNEFPPVKGDMLILNVTGNLTKVVTSGTYTIAISVSGFPLPDIDGDISAFHALPWQLGELNFTYSQEIPSIAPSGSYVVKISAVDQDKTQIFCISISFSLSAAPGQSDVRMQAATRKTEDVQAEALLAMEAVVNQRLIPPAAVANNIQRLRPHVKMPTMRPVNGNNNRR